MRAVTSSNKLSLALTLSMPELRGLQLAGDPDAHQDGLPGPPPQRGRAAAGRPELQPPGHRIRDR